MQTHKYRVRNVSGNFDVVIEAQNSHDACMKAFNELGAHHRSKLYSVMIQNERPSIR